MTPVNYLIIEDDLIASKHIEKLCSSQPDFNLVGVAPNPEAAAEMLRSQNVDLVFLDVELSGSSGLNLIRSLPVIPQIIVITAHEEFAFEAFELNAIDYLKKPVTKARFDQAIQRFRQMNIALTIPENHSSLFIKVGNSLVAVQFDKILLFESIKDYVKVITEEKTHVIYSTMKSLEEKLPSSGFGKVNRSFIVNIDKVKLIKNNHVYVGNQEISISKSCKDDFFKKVRLL